MERMLGISGRSRLSISRLSETRISGFIKELIVVSGAFLLYSLVRSTIGEKIGHAFANAASLIDLEKSLGFFWELQMQNWVLDHTPLIHFFNQVYIWGFGPLIIISAVWLYWCRRSYYVLYRNALLISGGIALLCFYLLPTAPPRFLQWVGFEDTIGIFVSAYRSSQMDGFLNHYAAFPSMHFGWILLLSMALFSTTRSLPLRIVWVLLPVLMFLAIIVTGNHFIVDAIAGGAVALVGLLISLAMRRYVIPIRLAQGNIG